MLYFVKIGIKGYCTNVLNIMGKAYKGVDNHDFKSDLAEYH